MSFVASEGPIDFIPRRQWKDVRVLRRWWGNDPQLILFPVRSGRTLVSFVVGGGTYCNLSVERVDDDDRVEGITTLKLDLVDRKLDERTRLRFVQVVRHIRQVQRP